MDPAPLTRPLRAFLGALLGALLGAAALAGCDEPFQPVEPLPGSGDFTRTLESGGLTRRYEIHVPPGLGAGDRAPVVLAFHGVPRGAGGMHAITGLDAVADERGFVVVYPLSSGTDWAVGCGACTSAGREGVDEVRFVRDLLDRLAREAPIDPARVLALGFSQGAVLTHRLACEAGDRLAAVASVGATMLRGVARRCDLPRPLPVTLVLGTEDDQFPWEGTANLLATFLPAEETARVWARLNGCATDPTVASLPDTADDGTTVRRLSYPGCRPGGEVDFFVVEGGGHTWPGSPAEFSAPRGRKSRDLDATRLLVDRFLGR